MNYWPRWIRAIRGKTMLLSMAQMGAYDRLLDYYYEEEKPLPADLDACCRIAGAISKQDRADVVAVLGKFFALGDDGYSQERATQEIAIAQPKIAAAQANGVRGGRPKGTQKKPKKEPTGLFQGTGEEPTPKAPHPHISPSLRSGDGPCVSELVEAGFDEQTAHDFIAHKVKVKAPLTARAWADHQREASKAGWTALDAAVKVLAKSWKGFEAKYVMDEKTKLAAVATTTVAHNPQIDATRALLARQAEHAANATPPPAHLLAMVRKAVKTEAA